MRTCGELRTTSPALLVDLCIGGLRAVLSIDRTDYYYLPDPPQWLAGEPYWHTLPPGEVPAILREMAESVRAVRWPS